MIKFFCILISNSDKYVDMQPVFHNRKAANWRIIFENEHCKFFVFADVKETDYFVLKSSNSNFILIGPNCRRRLDDLNRITVADMLDNKPLDVSFSMQISFDKAQIIRDVSGQQPCYELNEGVNKYFFSSLSDFFNIRLPNISINYQYMIAQLHMPRLLGRQTAINEIKEVPPGVLISYNIKNELETISEVSTKLFSKGKSNFKLNQSTLAQELYHLIIQEVKIASHAERRIALQVSGGFDSAVVAASLAGVSYKDVIYINFYNPDETSSFDREQAAAIAKHFSSKIIHVDTNDLIPNLDHVFSSILLSRPSMSMLSSLFLRRCCGIMDEFNCSSMWTGTGGDSIFQYNRGMFVGYDYIKDFGLGSITLMQLQTLALYEKTSVFDVALRLIYFNFTKRYNTSPIVESLFKQRSRLIRFSRNLLLEFNDHPWLKYREEYPGRRALLLSLIEAVKACEHHEMMQSKSVFHPLVTYNIIKYALSIPSYQASGQGIDRILARMSFAHALPKQITNNKSKSNPADFYRKFFIKNFDSIRSIVLDGILIKNADVDRGEIEKLFRTKTVIGLSELHFVLQLFCQEVWVSRIRSLS